MGMTLAELQEWPPHIKALADAASKRGDASQQTSGKVQAIVDISTWQGDAGDAAKDAMKRSAARFDNAGFEAMYVAMHANKAYGDSQALADDIGKFLADAAADPPVAIDPKTNTVTPPDITGKKPAEIQKIIDKLKDLHSRVTGLIARGEVLDDDLARVLDQGTGGHTLAQKQLSEETPQQAQQDVHDVLAGTATDEEKARVQAASTLSPEQVADRDAGRPVQLTRSQQLVLGQMNDQMKGMSIEDIHRAERRLGDNKSIVGNALQMMSSNQYAFAKSERPGEQGSTDKLATGGFNELPTSVQNLLNDKSPVYQRDDPTIFNPSRPEAKIEASAGNLNRLSEVIMDGDAGFQRGTELDHKLLQRGADILQYENHHGDSLKGPVDSELQNIFKATSRDHIAVHDIMTGPDGQRNDRFLGDLTSHVFPDRGAAAGSLFSWTGTSAVPGDGVSLEDARTSGETARAYASYLAEHPGLAKHPMGIFASVGDYNPGLIQGMANGLAPYTAAIAGGTPDIFGKLPGFGDAFDTDANTSNGKLPEARNVFNVLSSDPEAAKTINGALYRDSVTATQHYADSVHKSGSGAIGDLDQAGRFRALADSGLTVANNQQHGDEKALHDLKSKAYDAGTKLVKLAGPEFGMMANALKSSIIGSVGDGGMTNGVDMAPESAQHLLLNAYLANGTLNPGQVSPQILVPVDAAHPNGPQKIGTLEEINKAHPNEKMSASNYHTQVNNGLKGVPGEPGNADPIRVAYNMVAQWPA
ncbi:hypothetical protein [Mycobacteroides franklinii]|uniref:TPR repeat domain-containing protein n=1 Tax=Mycobacteroides franklinii TaxID=948102 RepID=A0A4R8R750_9MYCO|nr:hypothetical protein [Mycobacteroides franklinii]TDZ41913.1 hypothetical protein CCUG64054_01947 [Mycobacteroides franklinii]TDZ52061.1 hypothetical protein CCUG63697_00532 [Mycobacteroides franklinii]TDZ55468.1 hypothetical protein CCUG63696_01950 [Mycobacteroides franklinii]TDZ62409.1 hypothetical protein CCUG63695_01874 [Mycobacteroides franklinii]TDZ68806.1 hypothetical protein CCUG64056_01947 [Mycobacteroides franklinii]